MSGLDLIAQGDGVSIDVLFAVLAVNLPGSHRHWTLPFVVAQRLDAEPLALILLLAQLLVDILRVARVAGQTLHDMLDHGLVGCGRLVGIRNNILDDMANLASEILVLVLLLAREDGFSAGLLVVLLVILFAVLVVGTVKRAGLCGVTVPVTKLAGGAFITWRRISNRS